MGADLELDPLQLDLVGDFESQVTNVLQTIRLTRREVDDLQKLFFDLERSLQNAWPGCRVMPFGSIVTGLGIISSDVDVYVYIPDDYDQDPARLVLAARNILRRQPMIYHHPFAITSAKVPIITFNHIPTRRSCDVSFKSPSGVRNSKLIAHLLQRDPRALPLTILIKYWSKVHKLSGTNLLPNYALTMLTIFYMQQKNILPPIVSLQSSNNSFFIDDWNTAFNEKYMFKTKNDQNLYELLGDFFKYYSSFKFEEYIISPFMGSPVPLEAFRNIEDIPKEFELYKRNLIEKACISLKIDSKMCIQDPFQHNRNCTIAVFPRLAQRFHLHVELASKIYEESESSDFLRDILTKKPIIPREFKKNRRNKGLLKTAKVSNKTDELKKEENNIAKTLNENAVLPNNDVIVNTATLNTVASHIKMPKKRTLYNSLTQLYRRTKKRKI